MFWCVSFRSDAFWTVLLLHETWCKSAKLVQLMQKFMPQCRSRIFRNECSRSTPLDPKLMFCFVLFLSVWGHLEPFCYCMKLAAKRAKLVQLMQKFVPRCLVRIFCNERSRSIPLDPKLMCWVRFPPFGCILEQFCYCTKLGAKRAKLVQLMQKFVQRCLVRIFQNECSRSTPLDPKLMFWCVSFRSATFEIVSLLHETWCKTRQTGAITAKLRATISC